jgi:hypothetical protein
MLQVTEKESFVDFVVLCRLPNLNLSQMAEYLTAQQLKYFTEMHGKNG